jgi:hypothetical protein
MNTARLLGRYDKKRYHYFKRPDGTKRYYRTGQSLVFSRKQQRQQDDSKMNNMFPWANPKKTKRRNKNTDENWGLFVAEFKANNGIGYIGLQQFARLRVLKSSRLQFSIFDLQIS